MPDSEVAKIFKGLKKRYVGANIKKPTTFYFSLDDDEKWTVAMAPGGTCSVKPEKTDNADCFFKSSKEMFLDVWNGKHTPSVMDFMTGKIKSNNPTMLKDFVAAFQKSEP